MSNARSPREVCSTTIGTSGLIRRASLAAGLASPGSRRAGGPERALALLGPFLLRRPQRLAGGGALDRDRARSLDHHVRRLPHPQLVAKQRVAPGLAEPRQQLLGGVATLARPEGL